MLSRRFEYRDDFEFGPGFCPAWMPDGNPVQGFGAAHDTLEHFPNCIGGFEGEMMAFGAMHVVRRYADWRLSTIYQAQAADIGNFIGNVMHQEQTLRDPGNLGAISRYEGDYGFDSAEHRIHLRRAVANACKEDYRGATNARRALPPQPVERMIGWMILGYEKARKRFARLEVSDFRLGEMFEEIEEGFDRKCRGGEYGDVITVRVNFKRSHVEVVRSSAYD